MSTPSLPNTSEVVRVVRESGVAQAALTFDVSPTTVRRCARAAGLRFKIGRPRSRALAHRNAEIFRQRQDGKRLNEIGLLHGIGVERVRQILADVGGDPQNEPMVPVARQSG